MCQICDLNHVFNLSQLVIRRKHKQVKIKIELMVSDNEKHYKTISYGFFHFYE